MNTLQSGELLALYQRAFSSAGANDLQTAAVSEALVAADIDGLPSHGLYRVVAYCKQLQSGKINGQAEPQVMRQHSGILVDAQSGFGFSAINEGINHAIGNANAYPITGIGIANSHHAGVMGHHVERIAEKGFVALAFSNSPAAIAPWGGMTPTLGTNPIAFACPTKSAPLVIDLSLSKVARGKIAMAAKNNQSIAEGLAIDRDGNPTTDAEAALTGSMLPIGNAKGFALALMVEILAASLTASNHGFEASSFFDEKGKAPHIGQFFIVINPNFFANNQFLERVSTLIEFIKNQSGTRLPGERRLEVRKHNKQHGIEVNPEIIKEIESLSAGHLRIVPADAK